MLKVNIWQQAKVQVLAVFVFTILLFHLFSDLRIWFHQQIRHHEVVHPITSIRIAVNIWKGEQQEITLNNKRFDIHHIDHDINEVTLYGEWDVEEDELLSVEKHKRENQTNFSGLSPFLFCSDLPHPYSYFLINHLPAQNGVHSYRWPENYLPTANPPPDLV